MKKTHKIGIITIALTLVFVISFAVAATAKTKNDNPPWLDNLDPGMIVFSLDENGEPQAWEGPEIE